jgi:cytoskeletal protein RodZ
MADEAETEAGAIGAPDAQLSTPGAKLRAAREAQGLSIQDVGTRTRIAVRQLEAVERDDYAALPGIPYAVGFARAYARAVDLDEVEIAAEVRHGVHNSDIGATRYEAFEPVDPARVPSRALAWTAALIVVVLIAGFTIWRTQLLTPPTAEEIAQDKQEATAARPAGVAPAAPVVQTVVFTAVDDVWLRIVDEAGERLKDGTLKKGESFTLPAEAKGPTILTGRPQALTVTVGGKTIPPLGAPDRTISDVPVSAAALLARAAETPALPGATPAATAPARTPAAPPAQRPTAASAANGQIAGQPGGLSVPLPATPAPAPPSATGTQP